MRFEMVSQSKKLLFGDAYLGFVSGVFTCGRYSVGVGGGVPWAGQLFIRDRKWGCSNPIINRITSVPHEPKALELDNQPGNPNRAAHVSPPPGNVSHARLGGPVERVCCL